MNLSTLPFVDSRRSSGPPFLISILWGCFICLVFGLSFAVMVGGPAASCVAQDIPEIEIPADAKTLNDYYQTCLTFQLHELELYQKKSTDSPAARKLVEPFIRYSIGVVAARRSGWYGNPVRPDAIELANAAMASDSEDPLYLNYAALFCEQQKEYEKALDFGTRSIKQFDKLKNYPRGLRFVLILRFVNLNLEDDEFVKRWRGLVDKWYDEALEGLPAFLVYGASLPDALRPTYDLYTGISDVLEDNRNPKRVGRISEALTKYASLENGDPWLLEMTQGWFAREIGWSYRGAGFAHEVKSEGWERFRVLTTKASKHFRAAHDLRPEFPEAAAALVDLANVGSEEESTFYWLEQAIAVAPDDESAFANFLNSLLPRWGGSHAEIIAFGQQCNKTQRYDTMVPYWLPLSLLYINTHDNVAWDKILSRPGLVDEVLQCCDKLLEDPARATEQRRGERLHILTMQICFAMKAERFKKAVELWGKMGDQKPVEFLLDRFHVLRNYDRSRCHAYAEFGEQLTAIRPSTTGEARANPETRRKVMSVYSELAQRSLDPKSKFYLRHWVNRCQKELDFENGKWVDLEFTSDNDMWQARGDWTFNKDEKAMYLKSKGYGVSSFLSCQCLFPGPKEVRVEVATTKKVTWAYELGVLIGLGHGATCFWVDTTRQSIGNENGHTDGWSGERGPIGIEKNELRVKYWNKKSYELWVDGFRHYLRQGPSAVPANNDLLGIGLPAQFSSTGEGWVANVRVRKLVEPPVPRLDDHRKRLKYFSRLVAQNPERYDYLFERGLERFYLNQVSEAIADFELAAKNSPDEHEYHHYLGDLLMRTGRVKEGLKQLEMSSQAFPASRFHGQSLLAYHLATVEDDQLRDGDRATEIVLKAQHEHSMATIDSALALAAALVETGDLDSAVFCLKNVPKFNANSAPWRKVYRPTAYADAKRLAEKIIAKRKEAPFTLIPIKADPETSTRSLKRFGVGLTTNDTFTYSPQSAEFCFPVMSPQFKGKPCGFQARLGSPLGNAKVEEIAKEKKIAKEVVLSYFVDAPHVVVEGQPTIVVDLYGRRLERAFRGLDNNIEVLLFYEGEEVGRKSKLAIPDKAAPYVRASFSDLELGTKIDQIKIVARPKGRKNGLFTLQEIRAAAIPK